MSTSATRILVVEDDVDIRESMVELLEDEGFVVAAAADGVEALSWLDRSTSKPDLILLDLMMPNMNGFEFREAQLQNPDHAGIPVAVLTADGNASIKADKVQADGWLRKPIKLVQLLELIARVLKTTRTR